MEEENLSSRVLDKVADVFIPNISVDCIILSFHQTRVRILLSKLKVSDKWMIPGSFVRKDEDPDDTANRIINEKTDLTENLYLKQFYFFGRRGRINIETDTEILDRHNMEVGFQNQHKDFTRFISLAYYSLVKYSDVKLSSTDYEEVAWFDVSILPELYADHKEIIQTATNTIRKQIGYIPIGYELLPEKFTMPELRSIYEAIIGKELDRRNFQRKMLSIGYILPLNETRKVGAHKSPNLYTFIEQKYKEAERDGIQIMNNIL
ncbi:MAG: NUDIX domain-containing protein [Prevotella sp.]|jgi:hypothetical protein|nr:NUDIX domain-containing protein [Prevotella sp.]